ncbi:MAG: FAD-dependent oxidoreductase, partial [Actinomycetota bacterium]|nr:FAD-dependent oxidoreductase [Actinomycetota bacterium]
MTGANGAGPSTKPKYHLEFTEEMKGFFTFNETDYQKGFDQGQASGSAVMFHLTIGTDDTYAFVADPTHVCPAVGYVFSDVLGGRLPVERGVFNLFVDAGEINAEPARHMLYRLWFKDSVGHPLTLTGFKDIRHPVAALSQFKDVWGETTTLYTKILAGHVEVGGDDAAPLVGSGIIHILPLDFAHQLTTFRVKGPDLPGRWRAFQTFGGLFMGQLWEVFQPRLPWR